MTVIDHFLRLADQCPSETDRSGRGNCFYCSGGNYEGSYIDPTPTLSEFKHESDCPWLSLRKIAAALDAAERVTIVYEEERVLFGRPPGSRLTSAMAALNKALDGFGEAIEA